MNDLIRSRPHFFVLACFLCIFVHYRRRGKQACRTERLHDFKSPGLTGFDSMRGGM